MNSMSCEEHKRMLDDRRKLMYLYNAIEKADMRGLQKQSKELMEEVKRIKDEKKKCDFKDKLLMLLEQENKNEMLYQKAR